LIFQRLPFAFRVFLNAAIFLAGLIAVCASIRATLPFPEVVGVYQKWLYFGKHKDRYDVLFLGSSRFYHQIIPKQFDERVSAATGRELRSFNFGYDAMWPPESFWMLRQLLAMKPAKLRWVFIDCIDIIAKLDERNTSTRRTAYWHDAPHTFMALDSVGDMGIPLRRKRDLVVGHMTHLFRQWTNQGRGAEQLTFEFGLEKRKKAAKWDPPKAWDGNEGYEPETKVAFEGKEREKFEADVAAQRQSFPPYPTRPSFLRALNKIIAEVRAAGAEPILVVTPTVDPRENFQELPPDVTVWRYHDANEFPALYETANRYDGAHLNDAGARIFTDLLAARFSELLNTRQ
jgi:hypothetical protein